MQVILIILLEVSPNVLVVFMHIYENEKFVVKIK